VVFKPFQKVMQNIVDTCHYLSDMRLVYHLNISTTPTSHLTRNDPTLGDLMTISSAPGLHKTASHVTTGTRIFVLPSISRALVRKMLWT
jgi:hypothetical protein